MSSARPAPARTARLAAAALAAVGLTLTGVAAAPVSQASPATSPRDPGSLLAGAVASAQPRDFIATLEPGIASTPRRARSLAGPLGGRVLFTYDEVLEGFAVRLPALVAPALRALPQVATVRRDVTVSIDAEQPGATWGLDRTDQRALPLDSRFGYADDAGRDAHVYVIDTGLAAGHAEFSGRVGQGRNFVAGGFLGTGSVDPNNWADCQGHGTHVASTAAGTTWGVAKQATVHGVRVLNCQGSGSGAAIIAGMDWVAQNAAPQSVANLSLGSAGVSTDLNNAAAGLVQAGVAVAVAAGNDNADACGTSPAAAPSVLTVGATDRNDVRSSFSNRGTCVDLFAPGTDITAANYSSTTGSTVLSGTSMASPHVAGVLALVRSIDPTLSATAAQDSVVAGTTSGVITNVGAGSPNKLLWSGVAVDDPSIDRVPVAAFTASCSGLTCSFDAAGSTDDRGIASYAWDFGDGSTATGSSATRTYAAAGTRTVTLTVTDTAGQVDTESRTVSPSTAPCTSCQTYTGTTTAGTPSYPAGSGGFSHSGLLEGFLRGAGTTNLDLVLQRRSCGLLSCSWSEVAASRSAGSSEDISRTVTSGTYRWVIVATSGSSSWQFYGAPR